MRHITSGLIATAFLLVACTEDPVGTDSVSTADETTSQPNFLILVADDMGYTDIGAFGGEINTPNLDSLAQRSMKLTNAHSGSAVCTPTRYGVITGRYSWRSRLKRGVLGGASKHLIDPTRMTVASYLKQHGYHTACIGKWHLGMDFAKSGKQIDFSGPVTNGPSANGFDYYYCHNGSLDMAPYVYVENGRVTAAPGSHDPEQRLPGFLAQGKTGADFDHHDVLPNLTRRAAKYITERAAAEAPFFLYLALPAPHTPDPSNQGVSRQEQDESYGDFVLQVDDTVGQVMKAIEKAGIADNTLLIVTADNGCSPRARFGELEKFGHDPSHVFRGHKADIYEGGHHVPFWCVGRRWSRLAPNRMRRPA